MIYRGHRVQVWSWEIAGRWAVRVTVSWTVAGMVEIERFGTADPHWTAPTKRTAHTHGLEIAKLWIDRERGLLKPIQVADGVAQEAR